MKVKSIFFLLGIILLTSCKDTSEKQMNWSYEEDYSFVEQHISDYQGLQDVALGNLKYVINTRSYKEFLSYIEQRDNLTGTIYYELNVNDSHFLITVFFLDKSILESITFSGGELIKKRYLATDLKPALQPKLKENILISDGYLLLRVDIKNDIVTNRFVNVLDELSVEPLIGRASLSED